MDDLENRKRELIRIEMKRKGRKLTGPEALAVEKKAEEDYPAQHETKQNSKSKQDKLPLSMYRFD